MVTHVILIFGVHNEANGVVDNRTRKLLGVRRYSFVPRRDHQLR